MATAALEKSLGEFPESLDERVQLLADVSVSDIAQRYKMQQVLGSGAQATVYQALAKKTQRKTAVLDQKELEDDDLFDALRMEIMILKQLKHPYIVNLIEVVRDQERIYIVQECLGGGELFEQLLAKGPFKEDYALTIFAQVAIAVDYIHKLDVVHRDLKAENLVFAAKGSPVIKFIDFGGACTWTAEDGLTGLVGTPQYVAPEVVTGYGENNATNEPYGKGCDLWSMGVLLFVMLSKTMPFRAKEVDQLLKQVVRAKFNFRPEDRWKNVSEEAKDLITKLLTKDVSKRLTIADVKKHPWCADAIARALESMPKMEVDKEKPEKSMGALFKPMLQRIASGANRMANGEQKVEIQGRPKNKGVSREQQYWYAMEISPPSNMKQEGGVKVGEDGQIMMDGDVPPEMRAMLEEIQKAKAARGGSTAAQTPPSDFAAMQTTGNAMDTLLMMNEKDAEIERLHSQLERLEAELKAVKEARASQSHSAPPPPPSPGGDAALAEAMRRAEARADKAELEQAEQKQSLTKLQAKLNAVSTLYTEAAQREAVLRLQLEQSGNAGQPSYE